MSPRSTPVRHARRAGRLVGLAGLSAATAISLSVIPAAAQDGGSAGDASLPLGSLGDAGSATGSLDDLLPGGPSTNDGLYTGGVEVVDGEGIDLVRCRQRLVPDDGVDPCDCLVEVR